MVSARARRYHAATVWLVSLRDLQWRRRRFAIAIVATAFVFALSLLLSGVASSFRNEVVRTVASFEADAWIIPVGASGPVTAPAPFPTAALAGITNAPGVRGADPVVMAGAVTGSTDLKRVNLIGVVPGGIGAPVGENGGTLRDRGEAIVDASLGLEAGDTLELNGVRARVVDVVHGITYFAGQPVAFVPLADAQQMVYSGEPLATAVVTKGVPQRAPPGFRVVANEDIVADMERPLAQASQTVGLVRSLLWAVAVGIIGAIVYLTALERTRDFAVLKATGVSTGSLLGGLVLQAMVLALVSVVLAMVIERLMRPAAAMSVEVSTADLITLPVVAVIAGVLASLVALRRTVTVDPALAFAG
jgi:putative ABC transport system permease protein